MIRDSEKHIELLEFLKENSERSMSTPEPFDPLIHFAEIERLVSKIYFRFSHLFLPQPKLRDFWWEMAKEEEQHACILNACRAVIENYEDEKLGPEHQPRKGRRAETMAAYLFEPRHSSDRLSKNLSGLRWKLKLPKLT